MNPRISIILVAPESAGNIGAVARAMKNTGLRDLRLVNPPAQWKAKGKMMAMSAYDLLEKAVVYKTVKEAIADAALVVGTTRRKGPKRGNFSSFEDGIKTLGQFSKKQRVAVLFGKESKGLDNASLKLCDWALTIPSDPAYPSLNLAQAVMVVSFSIYREKPDPGILEEPKELLSKEEVFTVLERFREALDALSYGNEGAGDVIDRIVATLHGLLKRSGLMKHEAHMFKGFTRRICERALKK